MTRGALFALAAIVAALVACGDDDNGTPTPTTPDPTTTPATATSEPTSEPTATPEVTDTPTPTTTPSRPEVDPGGPDLLFEDVAPECETIIGGALSGADVLNIFVRLRNDGASSPPGLVRIDAESDTGLSASAAHSLGSVDSVNPVQVDLEESDYGQTHTFTLEADPQNEIVEADESNNTLVVTVDLRQRTTGSQDCS